MAANTLVTALHSLIDGYSEEGKPFSLIMLIPTEPGALESKFTLLFSAPWLDELSPRTAIDLLLHNLIAQFGSTASPAYKQIARVNVVHSTDPFVTELTSAFTIDRGEMLIQDRIIHNVHVEYAVLVESHSPTVPA